MCVCHPLLLMGLSCRMDDDLDDFDIGGSGDECDLLGAENFNPVDYINKQF